jgi:membrane protein
VPNPRFRFPRLKMLAGPGAIVLATLRSCASDRVSLAAAGCAFWATTAMFPTISALVAIYGLISDPLTVLRQLALLTDVLPPPAYQLIHERVLELVRQPHARLSGHVFVGIFLALWSAATGTKSMLSALNVVYDVQETRGIVRFQLIGLALTCLAVIGAALAISGVVLLPAVLAFVGLSGFSTALIHATSLTLLVALFGLAVTALYRVGPSRHRLGSLRTVPGAATATGLWLLASGVLSYYISHLSSFGATYGSIGAVVGIMLWFYISAYATLLGAELNAQLEALVEAPPP